LGAATLAEAASLLQDRNLKHSFGFLSYQLFVTYRGREIVAVNNERPVSFHRQPRLTIVTLHFCRKGGFLDHFAFPSFAPSASPYDRPLFGIRNP
jgi:hypothetical protein